MPVQKSQILDIDEYDTARKLTTFNLDAIRTL